MNSTKIVVAEIEVVKLNITKKIHTKSWILSIYIKGCRSSSNESSFRGSSGNISIPVRISSQLPWPTCSYMKNEMYNIFCFSKVKTIFWSRKKYNRKIHSGYYM